MFLRPKERTPNYENAVAALHKLAKESQDLMGRAFAEVDSGITKEWMTKGLRRSSGSQSHLRLLGKNPRSKPDPGQELPFFADHTDLWLKDGRPFLWTTQPYGLTEGGIRELTGLIDLGLDVTISTHRSWHFPGSTLMIELRKDKERKS